MEANFWHTRWETNTINFHQGRVNAMLEQHAPALTDAESQSVVFVPLCGKAFDLTWLRSNGHNVIGVELSEIAVQSYFEESGISPAIHDDGPFKVFSGNSVTLYCGDVFALRQEHLANVTLVYDRAALVALPFEMRIQYVEHMMKILPDAARMLLVTFEYDQQEMNGPPFSVTERDVRAMYARYGSVESLQRTDVLASAKPLRDRGLTALYEHAILVTR